MAVNRPPIDEAIHVAACDAGWPAIFGAEHARISQALRLAPDDLQHVGSTAVPGMPAKPVVDLMLGSAAYPPSSSLADGLAALGYEALGEAGVPGRLYFRRRGEVDANLHVVLRGGDHWLRNLALREYLLADATARERYARVKHAAIAAGARNLLDYSATKAALLRQLIDEALARQAGRLPDSSSSG